MILEFCTRRNANGHRHYIAIDTKAECYTRQNPRMICGGAEIKSRDYNELIKELQNNHFQEVNRL